VSAQLNLHPVTVLVQSLSSRLAQATLTPEVLEPLAGELAEAAGAFRAELHLELAGSPARSTYERRGTHSSATRFRLPIRHLGAAHGYLAIEFSQRIARPAEVMLATETLLQLLGRAAAQANLEQQNRLTRRAAQALSQQLLNDKLSSRAAGMLAATLAIPYHQARALLDQEARLQNLTPAVLAERIITFGVLPAAQSKGPSVPGQPLRKIA